MKYFLALLGIFTLLLFPGIISGKGDHSAKILLIPLDDRPPCLQFTERMALIGNAEIITPPREFLGRFTTPGQPEKIIGWLQQQDMESFDAAIIALDMIAYGGVIASRAHQVGTDRALDRMKVLREIRKRAPGLTIYAQNIVMRIAPSADGENEAYRAKLAEWGEVSVAPGEHAQRRTAELEREIPAAALEDYKRTRKRNLAVNLHSVRLLQEGVIDYLLLSQDDAKPRGIHVADRERLIAEIERLDLSGKAAVQPGADEVSMLLLARALNRYSGHSPKIKAVYSSEKSKNTVMPYEDRRLFETVSYHIRATGSQEVENEQDADILFYVYASRFEDKPGGTFAEEINQQAGRSKQVIVADIDAHGMIQGGDEQFTLALQERNVFPRLAGYASWNTAANTIGTALSQGVVYTLAEARLLAKKGLTGPVLKAQHWFLFHRVLDDFYYHNLVRARVKDFVEQNQWNPNLMSDEATRRVEAFAVKRMQAYFREFAEHYFSGLAREAGGSMLCKKPDNMRFSLPWNRTFEAEIDFDLTCTE